MKQYIRYGILVILAVLLHSSVIKAADFSCIPVSNETESCILSQAPTPRQTVQSFYYHFSTITFCMEHVDSTQVPGNKIILLRINVYKMQQSAKSPECDRLQYLSPHPVPDTNYYIFGLRKIII